MRSLHSGLPLSLLALSCLHGAAFAQAGELTALDGAAQDQLGRSIALDGNTLIVGSRSDDLGSNSGSAYVFVLSGTTWSEEAKLTADAAGVAGDDFGFSVDIDGDRAVVGALYEDNGPTANSGAAYVFERTAGVWSQTAKLFPSDPATLHEFGHAVAVSGDTIVVGAPQKSRAQSFAGACYVFTFDGSTWSQQAKLNAPSPGFIGLFGSSLDVDVDTLVVGEFASDIGSVDAGRGYIYQRTTGTWNLAGTLSSIPTMPGENLGFDVALSGNLIVVGTRGERFQVFERSGPSWGVTGIIPSPDGVPGDEFATSVATDGTRVAVGAPFHDDGGTSDRGAVYVYEKVMGSWALFEKLTVDTAVSSDEYGSTVAILGDIVAGGVPNRDLAGTNAGSVVVQLASDEPGLATCFGVGCPCGNDDPSAGCINSTGSGARLTATGSTSFAADDVLLTATGCPPFNSGLFFGGSQFFTTPVDVGDGLGCQGGFAFRYFPGAVNGDGRFMRNGLVADSPPEFINPGDTRWFQAWTRDVTCGPPPAPCPTPCGAGSNLTNSYRITYTP